MLPPWLSPAAAANNDNATASSTLSLTSSSSSPSSSPSSPSSPSSSPSSPSLSSSIRNNDVVIGRRGGGFATEERRHHRDRRLDFRINDATESIRSALENAREGLMRRSSRTNNNDDNDDNDDDDDDLVARTTTTFLAGTAAFYATSFASQFAQHKFLGISTGTRPGILPSSLGMLTVALGSWAGHIAGLAVETTEMHVPKRRRRWGHDDIDGGGGGAMGAILTGVRMLPEVGGAALRSAREMTRPMFLGIGVGGDDAGLSARERRERKEAWMHAARICILGMLTYKAVFRMRYSSISPSSYTARGSFARVGIPAPSGFNYATPSQRARIERLGRVFGCHTCGSRMMFSENLGRNVPKFHGDHIPPVSVAKQLNDRWYRRWMGLRVSQRFYPQCRNCSNKQGGLLSRAINAGHRNLRAVGGGEESYFHGRRLRIGHLTGGVVAVLSIGGSDGDVVDVVKSSRDRVRSLQDWIEDAGTKAKDRIVKAWRDFR